MLTRTYSAALTGIEALLLDVEVNASGRGEQSLVSIVGLPDAAVRESRERIRSALYACNYDHPQGNTLINLAPADIRKEGASFDLPMALGLIAAVNGTDRTRLARTLVVGELALDGTVRPVKGVVSIALLARELTQIDSLIVPAGNAQEAAIAAAEKNVYPVSSLPEAVAALNGQFTSMPEEAANTLFAEPDWESIPDFADV